MTSHTLYTEIQLRNIEVIGNIGLDSLIPGNSHIASIKTKNLVRDQVVSWMKDLDFIQTLSAANHYDVFTK